MVFSKVGLGDSSRLSFVTFIVEGIAAAVGGDFLERWQKTAIRFTRIYLRVR